MKLVREHIFEKFEEESDPIHDMGIGIEHALRSFIDYLNEKYEAYIATHNTDIPYLTNQLLSVIAYRDLSLEDYEQAKSLLDGLINKKVSINNIGAALNVLNIKDPKRMLEMTKFIIDKGYSTAANRLESYFLSDESDSPLKNEALRLIVNAGLQQRIKKGNETNIQKYLNRILIMAAEENNSKYIKWALENGAEFDADNYIGLRSALRNNDEEMIKLLGKELQKRFKF